MNYFSKYVNFLALFVGAICAYQHATALNTYLRSKRGVRGDFSPSRRRRLMQHTRTAKKTKPTQAA